MGLRAWGYGLKLRFIDIYIYTCICMYVSIYIYTYRYCSIVVGVCVHHDGSCQSTVSQELPFRQSLLPKPCQTSSVGLLSRTGVSKLRIGFHRVPLKGSLQGSIGYFYGLWCRGLNN